MRLIKHTAFNWLQNAEYCLAYEKYVTEFHAHHCRLNNNAIFSLDHRFNLLSFITCSYSFSLSFAHPFPIFFHSICLLGVFYMDELEIKYLQCIWNCGHAERWILYSLNLIKNGFLCLSIYRLLAQKDDVKLMVFSSSRLLSMLDRYSYFIIIPSIECFSIYILSKQNLVHFSLLIIFYFGTRLSNVARILRS